MVEKKVGPSDFQAEVERLKAEGKFPSLDEVLEAVEDARQFALKIRSSPSAWREDRTSSRRRHED